MWIDIYNNHKHINYLIEKARQTSAKIAFLSQRAIANYLQYLGKAAFICFTVFIP